MATTTTKIWPNAFASVTKTEGPRTLRLFIPTTGRAEVTFQLDGEKPRVILSTTSHSRARQMFTRATRRLF